MEDKRKARVRKKIKIRKKTHKKQLKRIENIKKKLHQTFSLIIVVFGLIAAYLLIWGLIIEPNLPRHIYGPGDLKEFIFLLFAILLIAISYLFILIIKYRPLNYIWWDRLKLFYIVNFNLEKYAALRNMGIEYRHRKKKHRKHSKRHHKSITET